MAIYKNFFITIDYLNLFNVVWFYFANQIIIISIILFVILLGILLPNKANLIKNLNLITSYYLFIFFYFIKSDIIYNT